MVWEGQGQGRKGKAADPREGLDLTGAGTSWGQTHDPTHVEGRQAPFGVIPCPVLWW